MVTAGAILFRSPFEFLGKLLLAVGMKSSLLPVSMRTKDARNFALDLRGLVQAAGYPESRATLKVDPRHGVAVTLDAAPDHRIDGCLRRFGPEPCGQ